MFFGTFVVIIFLSLLIFIHELGHFWAAKRFGLLVEEFGFGLPPRAWGKKIGETIYSINWLPFGGFVKIFGENREDANSSSVSVGTGRPSAPAAEGALRSRSMESAKQTTEPIELRELPHETEEDFRKSSFTQGGMRGRGFSSLPIWKRVVVIAAGVVMNFLFGWIVLSSVYMIGIPEAILVTQVQPGSPAEAVGITVQDKILHFSDIPAFTQLVNAQQGMPVTITIERQGVQRDIVVTPRVNPGPNEGALGVGLLKVGMPQQGFFESLWQGLTSAVHITQAIFVALYHLVGQVFSGQGDFSQVSGPVGIVKVTADASQFGLGYLLQLLALISLNLAVLNILPFPALDGGRLFFLLIETLKGSPLPIRFEQYVNAFGMALLLLLMVVITIKDVRGLF